MFFLVYGGDTYRSRRKLAALRERFSATRDASGLNALMLRAGDDDLDRVAEALFATPFLAEKKLVVLEGFLGSPAADQEKLVDMLSKKPASTIAIFYEEDGKDAFAKSPLLPVLAKQQFTEEIGPLVGQALERHMIAECVALGVTLPPATARAVIAAVGQDMWQLHEELAKLCAFAKATGKATIDREMLETLVPGAKEEDLFAFIDACTDGRCADAAVMLEELLRQGTSELQLVAMLERQYRTLIAAADLAARGEGDKNVVARKLGIHPFPAGKALVAVRRHSPAALRTRQRELLEIERRMKTGGGAPDALLGVFIAGAETVR